jgi:hypothetical protein
MVDNVVDFQRRVVEFNLFKRPHRNRGFALSESRFILSGNLRRTSLRSCHHYRQLKTSNLYSGYKFNGLKNSLSCTVFAVITTVVKYVRTVLHQTGHFARHNSIKLRCWYVRYCSMCTIQIYHLYGQDIAKTFYREKRANVLAHAKQAF